MLDLPRRPPSEVEWEDLLVRLELMPKALRILLEEMPAPAGSPALWSEVEALARHEAHLARVLEVASGMEGGRMEGGEDGARGAAAAELFARLRTRNFAMLQRRGLEVWDWQGETPDGQPASMYRMLATVVCNDVAVLAAIRSSLKDRSGAC